MKNSLGRPLRQSAVRLPKNTIFAAAAPRPFIPLAGYQNSDWKTWLLPNRCSKSCVLLSVSFIGATTPD